MNIGLFTSVYFNNIGNGFIDIGAECTIQDAKPLNAKIVKVSQCANFAASLGKMFMVRENKIINSLWEGIGSKFVSRIHDKAYTNVVSTLDVFSVAKIVKLDYLIIPGCVLTIPFFTIYSELLHEKVRQGCKLIFLGASGNHYTDYEFEQVTKFLRELKPYAIITRDSIAYDHYAELAEFSYNGIDNVFFVNRLELPELETTVTPYSVINLELNNHRDLAENLKKQLKGKNIIYSDHKPFPYSKVSQLSKKNVMISDYPLDYLLLYRNVDTVYSDRVHACIPTLAFGNKAVLYSDSPRKALFQNVGIEQITIEPMQVVGLKERQDLQIDFLRKILV